MYLEVDDLKGALSRFHAGEMPISFKRLHPDAVLPNYAHNGDAGLDLTAISVTYDAETDSFMYDTGWAAAIPIGYVGLLFPRSSNRKTEAYLPNGVGVDDSVYRGAIRFCFKNRTNIHVAKFIEEVIPAITLINKQIDLDNKYMKGINETTDLDKILTGAPYKVGDRIGQLVIVPIPPIKVVVVDELDETERGDKGYGSSGK